MRDKKIVVEVPGAASKLRLDRSRHGVDVVVEGDSPYLYDHGTLGSVRIPLAHRSGVSPSLGLEYPVVINPRNSRGEEGTLVLPRGQSLLVARPIGRVKDAMDLRRIFTKEQSSKRQEMERIATASSERLQAADDDDASEEALLKQVRENAALAARLDRKQADIPGIEVKDNWHATSSRFVADQTTSQTQRAAEQGVQTMDAGFEQRLASTVANAVGSSLAPILEKLTALAVSSAHPVAATESEATSNGVAPSRKAKEPVSEDVAKAFAKLKIPKLGPKPFKPRHRVLFLLPGGARMSAYYHWVWVSPTNNDLFLISDLRSTRGSVFDPPISTADEQIQVVIGDKKFACYSMDCVLEFGCFRVLCLPAVRPQGDTERGYGDAASFSVQPFYADKQSAAARALNPLNTSILSQRTKRMPKSASPQSAVPEQRVDQDEPPDEFYPKDLDELG